jgi:hypothetical protein
MDNLGAGICASSDRQKKGAGYRGLSASIAPDVHPIRGWQDSPESVAAFEWNGWQLCRGISGRLGLEYADFPEWVFTMPECVFTLDRNFSQRIVFHSVW